MKVKQLLETLASVDPDAEVILQKDGEGNGYSPLSDIYLNAVYIPETTWYGEIFSLDWTAEQACMSEAAWQNITQQPRCVVLQPVN